MDKNTVLVKCPSCGRVFEVAKRSLLEAVWCGNCNQYSFFEKARISFLELENKALHQSLDNEREQILFLEEEIRELGKNSQERENHIVFLGTLLATAQDQLQRINSIIQEA